MPLVVLVLDDFNNSTPIALGRVRELAGPKTAPRLRQMQGEIRNSQDLEQALTEAPSGTDPFRRPQGCWGVSSAARALSGREREWQSLPAGGHAVP